jgi:hypothetical protein
MPCRTGEASHSPVVPPRLLRAARRRVRVKSFAVCDQEPDYLHDHARCVPKCHQDGLKAAPAPRGQPSHRVASGRAPAPKVRISCRACAEGLHERTELGIRKWRTGCTVWRPGDRGARLNGHRTRAGAGPPMSARCPRTLFFAYASGPTTARDGRTVRDRSGGCSG